MVCIQSCDNRKCDVKTTIGGFCFVNLTQQKIKLQGDTYQWHSNGKVMYPQEKIYAGSGTSIVDCNRKNGFMFNSYQPQDDMCSRLKIIFNDSVEVVYYRADTIGRSPFNLCNYKVTKDSIYYFYYFTEEDYQNALQQSYKLN